MVNMVATEGEMTNKPDRPAYLAPGEEEDCEEPPPRPPLVFHPAEWCYDMSGKKLMLIFNHCEFLGKGDKTPKPRKGTQKDVSALTETFEGRGFQVFPSFDDKKHIQILNILRDFCKLDHSNTSCVCVSVLTHGTSGGRVCAADTLYDIQDLINILQHDAPALKGKPKLLLVQACRGGLADSGQVLLDGAEDGLPPLYPDMLVLRASVEDFKSWRNSKGSWLIQEFCRVAREHPHRDILEMITLVTSYVARERQSKNRRMPLNHKKKQTPELRHTLNKLLRLPPPRSAPAPAGVGAAI